jgi:hypothetical protein
MITLYGRGGFHIFDLEVEEEEHKKLLYNVSKILRARDFSLAAELLESIPFEIYNGSNDFNDEFCVLSAQLPLNKYEEMRKLSEADEGKQSFSVIASVISEIGPYIRFVVVDLNKEMPSDRWQKRLKIDIKDDFSQKKTLPVAVCAVVNEVITGSHSTLDALFKRAGAPGEPPDLAHHSKWKTWLIKASEDPHTDAYRVLGKVLEEFMELDPSDETIDLFNWLGQEFTSYRSLWLAKRERVERVLQKYGLQYLRGGRIIESGTGLASEALSQALAEHDFDTINLEFRRAMQTVNDDPGVSITAGCALLEALFKAYLEDKGIDLPSKQTVKPLWSLV